jgi:cytochrome c oxidase assembly protein subunit 11
MNISKNKKNNQAILLMAFAIGMLLMSYAAVPLYKLFCQVTGYGGTPQKVDSNSSKSISQNISVRFDSSIEKNSIVFFKPEKTRMNVQIGENSLAFFRAVNNSNKEITTMSVFNVTPLQAGKYFNKIECFCFEEQVLSAREEVNMPVSFFIDPAIKDDKFINDLKEITLSYTMYIR